MKKARVHHAARRRGVGVAAGGARAAAGMPVVAFIHSGTANALARNAAAFRKGLSEAGYTEGQNVTVEYHWLEGHYELGACSPT